MKNPQGPRIPALGPAQDSWTPVDFTVPIRKSQTGLLPVSLPTPLSGRPAFLVNSVPIPHTERGQWVLVEVPIRRGCVSPSRR